MFVFISGMLSSSVEPVQAKTFKKTAKKLPIVSNVRFGVYKNKTRFVFEVSQKIKYKVFTLANPSRVVIDISESKWKDGFGVDKGQGLIKKYRYGLFKEGTTRIVLDVDRPVAVINKDLMSPRSKYPYRFVLDIKPTSKVSFLAQIKKYKKQIKSPIKIVKKKTPKKKINLRATRKKKLIFIDPGHGGQDPGNLGVIKIPEKVIVLATAKVLKAAFERTGRYQVILTRNKDIFLQLGRQSQMAHEKQADLFISLHLDAFKDPRVRGATIYTLNDKASDKEAAALARRENKSDIIPFIDLESEYKNVQPILIELMKRETMNFSKRLAQELQKDLGKVIKMRKFSHKSAAFVVLKGLDIPSVLIEMGYLTNKTDARLLVTHKTQVKISNAIVKSVDRFFKNNFPSDSFAGN